MIPSYQPATPQQPAPKPGQTNYPNIEKFNEEEGAWPKHYPTPQETETASCDNCGAETDVEDLVAYGGFCPKCHDKLAGYDKFDEEEEGVSYYRCEYCGELIDPVEEFHTHETRRYYGHSRGEQKEEGQDAWCYLHDKEVSKHSDDELDEDEEKGTEQYEESPITDKDRDCNIGDGECCEMPCDCTDCAECGYDLDNILDEEPDPSNPDRELEPDPDLPEPVEPDENNNDNKNNKEPFEGKPITADGLEVPDKIEIPERLYNDLMMMIEYSVSNDNEAGGFLIKAKHGELGVVGEQFGKDREIVLEPNEQLHEGEELIGTVHMHPVTPTASTGDVGGYMNDENEKVMLVVGADKSINVFFKTDFTAEGDYGDEISENFEQEDMDMLAEGLGFLWYRGEESDRTVLNLMSNKVDSVELQVSEETWPIEDLVKGLGIKGRPDIPEEYSTKKRPLRLQVPFSWQCNERRLI
jgi:proteasome lid subunit RPN8/RPN11